MVNAVDVHDLFDVMAGGLIGLACGVLAWRVTRPERADARVRPPG